MSRTANDFIGKTNSYYGKESAALLSNELHVCKINFCSSCNFQKNENRYLYRLLYPLDFQC